VLALVLVSCGGSAAPGATYPQDVRFEDHGSVSQSGIEQSTPAIAVAVDAEAKVELARLATAKRPVPDGRIAIAVFQGQQRTGGYSVRVEKMTLRTATTLEVRAVFTAPATDAIVTQVLTSPAHIVSVAQVDVTGVDRVVLVDASGKQQASVTVPIR
jgi:protease stability complex PrcB-like protein